MKIHAIQTGTASLTRSWREGVGHGNRRLLNTLLDREWTEPLPIYAFAIDHPEGIILVDTGETARVGEPGYYPRWQPFFRFAIREQVEPEQEIGPQLERLGIRVSDVRTVVLTHLHNDHTGGLHHFPGAEILVTRRELEYARGFRGRLRGYVLNRLPSWFDPTTIELALAPLGPFPRSLPLTKAGDVTLVPTPGHTPGQIAVLVEEPDHTVFIGGDSSYTEAAMLGGIVDGIGLDEVAELLTHERIRAYAAETPTVYLVAHDPDTPARLAERRPVYEWPLNARGGSRSRR